MIFHPNDVTFIVIMNFELRIMNPYSKIRLQNYCFFLIDQIFGVFFEKMPPLRSLNMYVFIEQHHPEWYNTRHCDESGADHCGTI